jgi:hypothetical protein
MTQQYLVGELSSLLAGLQPSALQADAVRNLRHDVEFSPPRLLPNLAQKALDLADLVCWAALDEGDAERFCHCAYTATALRDFAVDAGLLP